MPSHTDLLSEMEQTARTLVQNAQALLEAAKGAATADELQPLQDKQNTLVEQLVTSDQKLRDIGANKDVEGSKAWSRIQELLEEFEKANEAFITQLSVRKGLIHFEAKQIQKSKRQLGAVKNRYVTQLPPKKKRGKKGINTLS